MAPGCRGEPGTGSLASQDSASLLWPGARLARVLRALHQDKVLSARGHLLPWLPPHGQGPPSPHPPLELVLLFSSRPPGATGFPDPANCPERQAWVTGLGWGLQSLASLSNLGLPLFDE